MPAEGQQNGGGQGGGAPAEDSTYSFAGTWIVAGGSAATVGGTTYSLAPSGSGVYVNGQETTFSGPAPSDSVAAALMSAVKSGKATTSAGGDTATRTMATTASGSSSSGQGRGTESAAAGQQTGNGAAMVLPGVGLGAGLVMALL